MKKFASIAAAILIAVTALPLSVYSAAPKIVSVEIEDLSVMEYTHGYSDENGNFIYDEFYPLFTVTLSDGTEVESFGNAVFIDDEFYSLELDLDDQYNGNYWTAGNTYEVTGSILGVSDTFNVTVTETTIQSIEINDISVIENTHGFDDGEGHYIYEMLYPDFTVTFKDGTQIESNGSFVIIDGEWCFLEYDVEDQYMGNYWTVGNTYQVTGGMCGFTDTFNVTITPSPVERIEINDISVIENTNGYEDEDGNYIYYDIYPDYTVYLKDGSVISSNKEEIEIDGEYYCIEYVTEDQYEEYWTVGNSYQATGTFLGVSDTFNINIIENPISNIELIKQPDKTQYTVGEYFDLKGATVRLNYKDGTHEDFDIKHTYGAYLNQNAEYYSSKLQKPCNFECEVLFDSAGRQSVYIGFLNRGVECEVNVTDNLWESISLEEGEDRALVITATGSGGAVTHLKVLDMMLGYGEETDEGQTLGGVIITDGGIFDGVLNLMGDGRFSIGLNVSGLPNDVEESSVLTSNYLTEGDWLTARLILGEIYPVWSVPVTQFYGRITADNIDGLIKVAVMSMTMDLIENSALTDKGDYLEIDGEAVQGAVSLIFAVDDVDMTLSENYDAETGMYRFYNDDMSEAYTNIMPMELFYENGCWCLKTVVLGKAGEADDTYTVKLDEEFRISVIYTDNTLIIGDANSDGKVNGIDVNYMKRALAGTFEKNIAMDINGDGKVNGSDINLLKRYLVGSYVI